MTGLRFLRGRLKPTIFLLLGDLLFVNLAILLVRCVGALRGGAEDVGWELILSQAHWFLGLSVVWLLTAGPLGLYTQRVRSRVTNTVLALLGITGLFLLTYVTVHFFAPESILPRRAPAGMLPRRFVLYAGVLSLVLVTVWRVAYITFSTGLKLARSAAVGQTGGVREMVRNVIREIFASDGQQVSEAPSVRLEGRRVEEEKVYSVQEVAKLLKVHEATIWRWCRSGDLPAFRVGQQWRIAASDLYRLMHARADRRSGNKS